jgi:hypothetical protein
MKKVNESKEALMRIPIALVSGLILEAWGGLVAVLWLVNFFLTLIRGERNKEIANFCEIWNTQQYIFLKYMMFVSNTRPFPFEKMTKNMSKFEKGFDSNGQPRV